MKLIIILFIQLIELFCFSQEKQLYNHQLDGKVQIKQAIELAQKNNKHILIQVGGNWCPWCLRFHKFLNEVPKIDSLVQSSYIYVPLNYSRKNKNEENLTQLEFPQRFGFPVLVILDQNGKNSYSKLGIARKRPIVRYNKSLSIPSTLDSASH
ncbi:MAG: thioredoxin family protein [Bacteroidales bacterium]